MIYRLAFFLGFFLLAATLRAQNNADFLNQTSIPDVSPGTNFVVTLRMLNNGSTTWTSNYRLRSQSPAGNNTWNVVSIAGFEEGNPSDTSIEPGKVGVFTATFRAPAAAGNYRFQWQMWTGGASPVYFGEMTDFIDKTIVVQPRVMALDTSNMTVVDSRPDAVASDPSHTADVRIISFMNLRNVGNAPIRIDSNSALNNILLNPNYSSGTPTGWQTRIGNRARYDLPPQNEIFYPGQVFNVHVRVWLYAESGGPKTLTVSWSDGGSEFAPPINTVVNWTDPVWNVAVNSVVTTPSPAATNLHTVFQVTITNTGNVGIRMGNTPSVGTLSSALFGVATNAWFTNYKVIETKSIDIIVPGGQGSFTFFSTAPNTVGVHPLRASFRNPFTSTFHTTDWPLSTVTPNPQVDTSSVVITDSAPNAVSGSPKTFRYIEMRNLRNSGNVPLTFDMRSAMRSGLNPASYLRVAPDLWQNNQISDYGVGEALVAIENGAWVANGSIPVGAQFHVRLSIGSHAPYALNNVPVGLRFHNIAEIGSPSFRAPFDHTHSWVAPFFDAQLVSISADPPSPIALSDLVTVSLAVRNTGNANIFFDGPTTHPTAQKLPSSQNGVYLSHGAVSEPNNDFISIGSRLNVIDDVLILPGDEGIVRFEARLAPAAGLRPWTVKFRDPWDYIFGDFFGIHIPVQSRQIAVDTSAMTIEDTLPNRVAAGLNGAPGTTGAANRLIVFRNLRNVGNVPIRIYDTYAGGGTTDIFTSPDAQTAWAAIIDMPADGIHRGNFLALIANTTIQPGDSFDLPVAVRLIEPVGGTRPLTINFVDSASGQVFHTPITYDVHWTSPIFDLTHVSMTTDPVSPVSGEPTTFTVTVTNSGNVEYIIDDFAPALPDDLPYPETAIGPYPQAGNNWATTYWPLNRPLPIGPSYSNVLWPGETKTFTFTLNAPGAGNQIFEARLSDPWGVPFGDIIPTGSIGFNGQGVTLSTSVWPLSVQGAIVSEGGAYALGKAVKVSAPQFAQNARFSKWVRHDGFVLATEPTFSFRITEDTHLYAVYDIVVDVLGKVTPKPEYSVWYTESAPTEAQTLQIAPPPPIIIP